MGARHSLSSPSDWPRPPAPRWIPIKEVGIHFARWSLLSVCWIEMKKLWCNGSGTNDLCMHVFDVKSNFFPSNTQINVKMEYGVVNWSLMRVHGPSCLAFSTYAPFIMKMSSKSKCYISILWGSSPFYSFIMIVCTHSNSAVPTFCL